MRLSVPQVGMYNIPDPPGGSGDCICLYGEHSSFDSFLQCWSPAVGILQVGPTSIKRQELPGAVGAEDDQQQSGDVDYGQRVRGVVKY